MSNLGSMTKPMHAGKAAACGLLAARFAAEGLTAAADAIEHEQGFLKALSPAGERSRFICRSAAQRVADLGMRDLTDDFVAQHAVQHLLERVHRNQSRGAGRDFGLFAV